MPAPKPANESERLAALRSCGVLDTEPEPSFDEIAKLASQLCGTPVALVSLVDADRQWFKARVGLPAQETSRDVSFCAYSVATNEPLVVPDTHIDGRFADNPLVTADPNIRFYAGVPLMLESGLAAGTLCVIDRVPRELTGPQLAALGMLARQVTTELKLRRRLQSKIHGDPVQADAPRLPSDTMDGVPVAPLPSDDAVIARRYRIDRLLGTGGMGVVVVADDLQTGRRVAIKFLLRHNLDKPGARERFVREAQAMVRVQSEHVVQVLDVGNLSNGAPFIVMEHLEGEDLAARLELRGPRPVVELVDSLVQTCDAVEQAHARGVIHRDLKPSNLFRARRKDGGEIIKVLDFGVSKLQAADEAAAADRGLLLTRASTMVGSVYYMSPEQMNNARDIDGRSDIWSLGVILYELATGELPFPGDTTLEVCTRVLSQAPIPMQAHRPELPDDLWRVVQRCLQRARDDRYPTAAALREALMACDPARKRRTDVRP
jgi:tRNA A-37 threonylcarbamoyl transferase component Bud32